MRKAFLLCLLLCCFCLSHAEAASKKTASSKRFIFKKPLPRLQAKKNPDEEYLNISPNEIMEAVQQLTPQYRTVFNMYVVDGFTHKEIGEQLGINEGTSKSNFAKAKMNLKKTLAKKIKELNV